MENLLKVGELVETIDGTTEPRINCRRIAGVFYKVGDPEIQESGHCYLINDKYYKYNTGYIVYDHRKKVYVIKNNADLSEGIVSIDEDGNLTKGYFSPDPNIPNCVIHSLDGNTYDIHDIGILENSVYLEDLQSGEFFHRSALPVDRFNKPVRVSDNRKRNLPYDSREITKKYMKVYDKMYKPKFNPTVEKYGGFLKDLTFGGEFETTLGYVPDRISSKLGLIALRDGSISGLEYATIPLGGRKGVQALVDSIEELRKRTDYDDNCSIHFHIGGIPRTEEFFLALYKVLCTIQNEMYSLFPLFKQYNFGVKRKHYTKPLPIESTVMQMDGVINKDNIKHNFGILYNFLSMGESYEGIGGNLDAVTHHPSDPHGTSKWNIRSRYHWVNLIPLLFGNKQTIEFRLHTPTYDTDKILNYLVLCASIINFVKDNTNKILSTPSFISTLTLSDMIYSSCSTIKENNSYNALADSCYDYIARRRDSVFSQSCMGNIKGDERKIRSYSQIKWDNKRSIGKKVTKLSKDGKYTAAGLAAVLGGDMPRAAIRRGGRIFNNDNING